ncbi:hypothetical protein [Helicobacter pylori]|uniref:hypothetical protein n=1 Tax=Helicobacter pylori TaxID=210 RepID=UPI00165CCD95|nr:hypothetical protein [Helicobacter pylori]MBH0233747.1 hypothetical protein [Helicobacter pylori]MBH0248918.1 hypothetical protein [Helicobacter pylori]
MLDASSFILIVKNAFSIFKFLIAVFLFAKQIIKRLPKKAWLIAIFPLSQIILKLLIV